MPWCLALMACNSSSANFDAVKSPTFARNTAKFTLVRKVLVCEPPSCAVLTYAIAGRVALATTTTTRAMTNGGGGGGGLATWILLASTTSGARTTSPLRGTTRSKKVRSVLP